MTRRPDESANRRIDESATSAPAHRPLAVSPIRRFALSILRGRNKGSVAITFLFCLPIFLFLIGILSEYALLIDARLTVERAVASAARSAMTAFPTDPDVDYMDGVNYVNRCARLALAPISPASPQGASSEAQEVGAALRNMGVNLPNSFEARYTTAEAATTIEWTRVDANNNPIPEVPWEPGQFAQAAAQRIKLTIHYRYYTTVPVIRTLIGDADEVAGVSGRYVTFTASYIVQISPGRETATGGTGWPN